MGLADFKNSKNLATALTNSASNADEVHFPTDSQAIVHKGKKYGVPAIAGKLNLTSSMDVDNALKSLKSTNEVAFFLVTDSSGKIPSSQSAYDVPASILKKMSLTSPNATTNALLSVATASVSLSAIGVNVGDLIALTRVMVKVSDLTAALGISLSLSGEIEMYQYKILAMNDAKATGHSEASAGVMGLMSPWDKGQVYKIGTIESNLATASSELNRGNKKTMFTADNYNIDQCLDGGIYLYGRTGRSMAGNHSDEYYIVSVDTRYNRSDSKYYVTQRVYSVNYKNRAFERLIVTSATNNYNGTYNNWVQLSEEQYMSEGDVNDFVTIRNWYNSVVGTDSDAVINKYQEIVDFLANIPEGDTLNGIITALETAIDNQTAQHQTDIGNINSEITKIKNGTTTVGKATKATQDGNGKVIADTYMTKTDASKVKGFSSSSSIAYKKITITDSNTDGYGIFIFARQQVYLMTSNCVGGTTFMGHLWELGTNHNGDAIGTNTRYIHVKAVKSSNNDSPTTLYIALDAHTYFQIQTSGEITITDSTATEWNGITSSTAGWVSCTYANFNNTTYGVATTSANGLMSSTDKTNLNNALTHLDTLDVRVGNFKREYDNSANKTYYKIASFRITANNFKHPRSFFLQGSANTMEPALVTIRFTNTTLADTDIAAFEYVGETNVGNKLSLLKMEDTKNEDGVITAKNFEIWAKTTETAWGYYKLYPLTLQSDITFYEGVNADALPTAVATTTCSLGSWDSKNIADIIDGTTIVGASQNAQIAEQATKDGGGKVIATTYLTKTDASNTYATKNVATTSANGLMSTDMVKKVDNIQLSSNSALPIIQMFQEDVNNQFLIPYMQNDIAYPIARGGYIKVFIDGVEQTGITDYMCDGMPDFQTSPFINLTKDSVITIEIDSFKYLTAANYAFIVFSSNWNRPKGIKLEYKLNETDEWITASETDNNTNACYATYLYNANAFLRYIKYTITDCPATSLRITEIGVASYNSVGLNNIVLSKGGGEVYGNIAPYKDNKQYLGTSSKAWLVVNAYNLLIKKANGNRGKICCSGNNIIVYTNESDNTKLFIFDEDNYSFRRGANAPNMILGTSTYPWKNVYADMITSKGANITGFITLNHKSAATKSGIIWKNSRTAEQNGWANSIFEFKNANGSTYWLLGEYGSTDGLLYMYFGKNGYDGENFRFYNNGQFKIPAADGTAPLIVSSKTMVANLNAQYARMLFSSNNAPVNAGNALKPVYFNGGVPVACDVSASGNRWGVLTFVDSTGYFQIGKYLTFSVSDTKVNADVIVTARDANDADGAGLNINGTTIASGKFGQHSGYIGTDISGLSSYWCKLWELNYKSLSNDIDATIYLHSAYDDFRGIVHVRVRWVRKTNDDGTYTEGSHLVFIKQVVGNIPIDRIRLYYKCDINASTGDVTNGQIEIWGNVHHQYGVINAVLLSLTQRRAAESTYYYGTFAKNKFTAVQTPTLPNYVDMTNAAISQTAAKATNAQFAEIVKSVTTPTANNFTLQYVSGGITKGDAAGNAKEGSNADSNLWSYPEGGTSASSTTANIQTLRLKWSDVYFHDIFVSPNQKTIWHRWVFNGTAKDWMKVVESTESGRVVIEGETWEDTLRIKNKDQSNGEIYIYNGEQGRAVIRHYESNTPTDLMFNAYNVWHAGKQLAYLTDVTNHKPKTIANGGYINTLQETSNAQFIPFLQNELAHLIERGGSVSVAINGTEYTRDNSTTEASERKKFFDGCNSYYHIPTSAMGLQDTVAITITSPISYRYAGTIYCLMPNSWRGKNVKFELFYPSLNNGAGEWHTMYEGTNLSDGLVYQPIKTLYDANGNTLVPLSTAWNKLKVTITNFFSTDIRLRIAEIGFVSYTSRNSTAICLPRNGGEIYGGITPLNNSSYELGSSSKKWKKIYADNFEGLASKATADASGNNIVNTYATKAALAIVSNNADKANNLLEKITGGIATVPKADEAEEATNATNDINGNKIDETYALRGTGIATTSELSKYVSINKHYFGTLLLPIVTTDSAGAMSANDKNTLDDIPNTYATKTEASTTEAGLMSASDKEKLDGIAAGANKYSLPVASSNARGGVRIGYTRSGNNFGVALSSEKMYVNIPNATQSLAGLLSADDKVKVDSITSMQGTLESLETSVAGKTSAIDVTALMAENGTLYGVTLQDLAMSNLYVVSEGYCQAKYYGYSAESSYLAFHPTDGYIIAEGIAYVGSSIEKRLFVSRVEQTNTGVTCTSYETRVAYM